MDQNLYPTTALEDWVTNFYTRLNIKQPKQIDTGYIASTYEIFIHKKPMPAFYKVIGRYRGITIDSRRSKEVQREMFFHELCHILRHSGSQLMIPNSFRELQEWDARCFVRYAAIPHHMIKFIDLDGHYVIDQMVNTFKVTPKLCGERLEQIRDRSKRYKYVAETNHKYEV